MRSIPSLMLASLALLLLAGCGFHLRRSAQLPAGMQRVHLTVSGSSDFRRALARAVVASGSTLADDAGPGVAELQVPVARFDTDALTITGQGRISEYAVHFQVRFDVADAHGHVIVPSQKIDMSREFTYDASHAVGNATQVAAIRASLIQDMVQSMMFRLQAVAAHGVPASASSVPTASPR